MKALLLGKATYSKQERDLISPAQLYPFFDNRKKLQRELGLELKHANVGTFSEIEAITRNEKADVFFIRPSWQENPIDAERVIGNLRDKNPNAKIIFIDPYDQISSVFFNVLPYVDWFLKYQRLKDVNQYKQVYLGGTLITDYLVKQYGYDLQGWQVSSAIPEGYEHRIATGWFLTLTKRFKQALLRQPLPWQPRSRQRDIDIFCHVSYGSKHKVEWYARKRMLAIKALEEMRSKGNITASISGEFNEERTVSSRQYFNDLKRSRILVSPFGWGELTWRDYEAVCYDCLLVKPSVDHIATEPDIFIAGETYVPVRWDYADLEEKCNYYLAHPEEANRIIKNAREAYTAYFKQDKFVRQIEQLLQTTPAPVGQDVSAEVPEAYALSQVSPP